MKDPPITFVLRTGGEYRVEHLSALRRQLPIGLQCRVLTDALGVDTCDVVPLQYGWPGWWSKMELFRPDCGDASSGTLYLDLDTAVVGPLDDVVRVRQLTVLRDFYNPHRKIGSGLMYVPHEERAAVWRRWLDGPPEAHMRRYRGDQDFLNTLWYERAARWQDVLPGQVVSYKVHVRPLGGRIPDGARVVCFHGRPRPWQGVTLLSAAGEPIACA